MHWLTHLADVLLPFGLLGVFVGMLLESAAIPIPSEVLLPFAGYLVARGVAGWLEAGVAALAGGTAGSILSYAVAYWGGRALLRRLVRPHELERAERWFRRYGDMTVFFGRLVPGVRTYVSLPAGLARMPFGRFVLYSILGALPWTVLFMALGYAAGSRWTVVAGYERWVVAVGVLVVLAWLAWFWRVRRRRAA